MIQGGTPLPSLEMGEQVTPVHVSVEVGVKVHNWRKSRCSECSCGTVHSVLTSRATSVIFSFNFIFFDLVLFDGGALESIFTSVTFLRNLFDGYHFLRGNFLLLTGLDHLVDGLAGPGLLDQGVLGYALDSGQQLGELRESASRSQSCEINQENYSRKCCRSLKKERKTFLKPSRLLSSGSE